MSEVVTSTRVRKCDRSWDIRPESYLPTGVGHPTEVMHMTGVVIYLHYKHVSWVIYDKRLADFLLRVIHRIIHFVRPDRSLRA
jgi:hypothetical protein